MTRRVGSARGDSSDRPTVAIERYRMNERYHCERLEISIRLGWLCGVIMVAFVARFPEG